MVYTSKITAGIVSLRSVEVADAEFILSLRLDETLNQYLNRVEDDIDLQRKWVDAQRQRENDFYFIIEDQKGNPYGTISVYNIKGTEAVLGRWVSRGNALINVCSIIAAYDFAFYNLLLEKILLIVVRENERVLSFHRNFGAVPSNKPYGIYNGFSMVEYVMEKENYLHARSNYSELLLRLGSNIVLQEK